MRAGMLARHTVTIQSRTFTRGASGGRGTETWTTSAIRSANVRPVSARELVQAGSQQGEISHVVMMRYDADTAALKPKDRLIFDGRTLSIIGVINKDEAGHTIECTCKEKLT